MRVKKTVFCVFMVLAVSTAYSQQPMTLDEAIALTAGELGQRLRGGNIAVVSFSSNWWRPQPLSAYVIDEMNTALVRGGTLTVVDRQTLEHARQELNFHMSGEVSDNTAQDAGRFAGAQSVLTGSFERIGDTYRFRVRVIAVETGVLQYANSLLVSRDGVLTALLPAQPPPPRPRELRARERQDRRGEREWQRAQRTRERQKHREVRVEAARFVRHIQTEILASGGFFWGDDEISGGEWCLFAIRISPVPFMAMGLDVRSRFFSGDRRTLTWRDEQIWRWGGALSIGLVYPLILNDNGWPILTLFANGLLEMGDFGPLNGILGNNVTPGFDVGISVFAWFDIKYRGTLYENNYTHSIGFALTIPWGLMDFLW